MPFKDLLNCSPLYYIFIIIQMSMYVKASLTILTTFKCKRQRACGPHQTWPNSQDGSVSPTLDVLHLRCSLLVFITLLLWQCFKNLIQISYKYFENIVYSTVVFGFPTVDPRAVTESKAKQEITLK